MWWLQVTVSIDYVTIMISHSGIVDAKLPYCCCVMLIYYVVMSQSINVCAMMSLSWMYCLRRLHDDAIRRQRCCRWCHGRAHQPPRRRSMDLTLSNADDVVSSRCWWCIQADDVLSRCWRCSHVDDVVLSRCWWRIRVDAVSWRWWWCIDVYDGCYHGFDSVYTHMMSCYHGVDCEFTYMMWCYHGVDGVFT